MLTSTTDLGDFGWGIRSIGRGLKKVGKGAVKGTKFVAKKTGKGIVKGGKAVGRGTVKVAKVAGKVALAPAKFAFNLAMKPLRSRLGTLKNRRAKKIAWDRRKSKAPTKVEQAEAKRWLRKDLKKKGPHGKLLAVLAGSPPISGPLGELGEPVSASLVAAVPVLTLLLNNMIKAYAGGSTAPADPEKTPPSKEATPAAAEDATDDAAAAAVEAEVEPTTTEEVQEVAQEVTEEAAQEATEEALEGALLAGLTEAAEIAVFPAGITENNAQKIAGAAQRLVCGMSIEALQALGGPKAPNVVGTFCQAIAANDSAIVRASLPFVVQLAAHFSANCVMGLQLDTEPFTFGEADLDGTLLHDIGMLSVLNEADSQDLAFALAGVEPGDLDAASASVSMSHLALLPAGIAVLAGFWMLTRG